MDRVPCEYIACLLYSDWMLLWRLELIDIGPTLSSSLPCGLRFTLSRALKQTRKPCQVVGYVGRRLTSAWSYCTRGETV